ncbi:hypothetical protein FRB91_008681 [Serendipita sp. 411]|nr:hypothetical protein FRB91_008681 [Serendipita sp. 411]
MRKSLLQLALGLLALPSTVFAAFGITSSSGVVTVDSGAGLVIKINSSNGDITSIVYSSKQLQDSSKFTHISSGLGSVTTTTSVSGNYAKVTLKTSTLTQTYVVVNGQNNLYISTYTTAEPSVGELRFIARLSKSALPNGVTAAEVNGGTAIEGSDVFLLNGQTRSKFYSSKRFIEDQVHGVTGSGVGVWMVLPGTAYETSSGGPFMRDINNQGSSQQELYWYMNSGHEQTTASSSQIGARTLVIRITSSFASGRPVVTVNSWTSSTPAAPTKIDSRGVTRGTWRGNNQAFTYSIPSGTLIAGKNTFTINVASGSSGDTFLSPNIVYDSIVLY